MATTRNAFRWFAATLFRFRWLVLGVVVASALISVPYARRLRFDFSPEALIADVDSGFARQAHDKFGKETRSIIIVLEATGDRDIFSPAALNWQYQTHLAILEGAAIRRLKSLATLRVPRSSSILRPRRFDWLFASKTHDSESAQILRDRATQVKQFEGVFFSRDLSCTAIYAFLHDDDDKIDEVAAVASDVEQVLLENPAPAGYRVHLSGLPYVRVKIIDQLKDDQTFLIPLAGCCLGITLVVLFRCVSSLVLPLVCLGIGMLWTVAVMAGWNQPINIINNVLPIVLLVTGASSCVHILSRFAEESGPGVTRSEVTRSVMSHMIPACFLAMVTTAIGFLSLLLANADILQQFGWQAAMGLGMVLVSISTVFTSMGSWFRAPAIRLPKATSNKVSRVERVCLFSFKRPRLVMTVTLIPMLLAIVWSLGLLGGKGVQVNTFLVESIDEESPEIQSLAIIEEKLGGFLPVEVILKTDESGQLSTIDSMNKIRRIQAEITRCDGVSRAYSFVDVISIADAFLVGGPVITDGEPIKDDLRTDRRLVRIREALQRARVSSGIAQFITKDELEARILVHIKDVGTHRSRTIVAALDRALAREFPDGCGIQTRLTGEMYLAIDSLDGFVIELLFSLFLAALLIFVVLAIFFRSPRIGLVSILPNITPLLVTLGYMGLRGYDLDVANVTVFAIGLGIAVDDTIHFLARFQDELLVDGVVQQAMKRTARGSGHAILLTTVLIVGGMVVLLNSSFIPTQRFAELTIVTMLAALLGDLLLLPAIIRCVYRQQARSDPHHLSDPLGPAANPSETPLVAAN